MDGIITSPVTPVEYGVVERGANGLSTPAPEIIEVTDDYIGFLTRKAIDTALWAGETMDAKYYSKETAEKLLTDRARLESGSELMKAA